jgi:hypothetical protein
MQKQATVLSPFVFSVPLILVSLAAAENRGRYQSKGRMPSSSMSNVAAFAIARIVPLL